MSAKIIAIIYYQVLYCIHIVYIYIHSAVPRQAPITLEVEKIPKDKTIIQDCIYTCITNQIEHPEPTT